MKYLYLILLLLPVVGFSQSFPQMGCDGGDRYVNDIFESFSEPTTVQFGQNTTVGGVTLDLMMDIYEPDNDGLAERPVIVVAFGGSFIQGDRSQVEGICRDYARKGFVAVAIDYRIYDLPLIPLPDSLDMLSIVVGTVSDMRAAIRQLRMDAANGNPYRIDSDYIFASGVSAGAIVALHCAYLDETDQLPDYVENELMSQGGFEGDSNPDNLGYSSEVQGVVNYFGALNKLEWLNAGSVPLSSIHGTNDEVVPYAHADAFVCVFDICVPIITMDGSFMLNQQAVSLGIPSFFVSVEGGGHGDFSSQVYKDFRDDTGFFLHNEVLCGSITSVEELQEDVSRFVVAFPNPASDQLTLSFNNLNEEYNLRVFNSVGQLIDIRLNQTADQLHLSGSQYEAGFYQIRIDFTNADLAPVVKKVIFVK